ncbi:MAG: hypothetical protein AAF211_26825, partial [Myxococcota bacterium]
MPMRATNVAIIAWTAMACAKPVDPGVVRAQPIHPDLQCPAGTIAAGLAPPAGNEAWCENRPEVGRALRSGPSLTWHDSGEKASQGGYTNDVRTGPWLVWHPNGQLAEQGPYVAGVKDGLWATWDSLGRPTSE